MERLARRIAESAARNGGLDEERTRVIAYGLSALIQMLFLLVASLAFGILFHCLLESMIIFTSVGLMKRSSGGAHSNTSGNCTVISLVSIFVMALIARFVVPVIHPYWYIYLAFVILSFSAALLTVHRRAPVSTPNKPITRPEKIKRLRRQSFITVGIFFSLAAIMTFRGQAHPRLINGAISLNLAVLWQSFMLTEAGARLISFIDSSGSPRE